MLIKLIVIVVVLLILFVILVMLQPEDFVVERSITINAPPSDIFPLVNDLHAWNNWSPWAKLDPAMKQTFEGPPAGVGAIYRWSGNSKVGAGTMTTLESVPSERIKINLEFFKPFKNTNVAEFTFRPAGDQTVVTWKMVGKKVFATKAFGMIVNMNNLIGKDFTKGLVNLKTIADKSRVNGESSQEQIESKCV